MAAAFVHHENLFNALKDATGLHETIGASVRLHTSSASCELQVHEPLLLSLLK